MRNINKTYIKLVEIVKANLLLIFLFLLFLGLFFSTLRVIWNSNENHKIYIEEYESYLTIKKENNRLMKKYQYFITDESKIQALRETYDLSMQDEIIIRIQESQPFLDETKTYFDSPPNEWIKEMTNKLIGI